MRSMNKAIEEYQSKYYKEGNREALFGLLEINQIREKALTENNGKVCEFTLICRGLEAGFIIGYRKAQREYRAKIRKLKI